MTRFIIVTLFMLSAIYIAAGVTWTDYMTYIDWDICFDNIGVAKAKPRIVDMSLNQRWETFRAEYFSNLFWPFVLTLSPFLPLLLAMVFFKNTNLVPLIGVLFFFMALLFWPDLNQNPALGHNCDRKGGRNSFRLIAMPLLCVVTSMIIGIMAFLESKRRANLKSKPK